MTSQKRVAHLLAATLVVAGVFAFSGCSPQEPEPSVSPSVSDGSETRVETGDAAETMQEFVTAVYASDFATTESLASPGTAAAKYVAHQKAAETALKANGDFSSSGAAEQLDLEFEDGTAKVAYPDGFSSTWSEFEYDENGLVASWTTPRGPLPSLLWSADFTGEVSGNSVALISAYTTERGAMTAVVTVTAGSGGIGAMLPDQAQFVADDGVTYPVRKSSAPLQALSAGATGYVLPQFPQETVGGMIYLDGSNADPASDWTAEIPVAGSL